MAAQPIVAIPGRPGFDTLLWWVKGPSPDASSYSFVLDGAPKPLAATEYRTFAVGSLVGPDKPVWVDSIFLLVTTHTDGPQGKPHKLVVSCAGSTSNTARSRTLPDDSAALELILASCFYAPNNRLSAGRAFPAHFSEPNPPPHLKILCGDQIYLDLTAGGLVPLPSFHDVHPWDRYLAQWLDPDFQAWMEAGANLCMADDHEFWNNYPSPTRLIPLLNNAFQAPVEALRTEMYEAFVIFQATLNADPAALWAGTPLNSLPIHSFEFPGQAAPVAFQALFSMMVLDTRTRRLMPASGQAGSGQFTDPAWADQTIAWLKGLKGPGILVTTQPLLDKPGDTEAGLPDFGNQFRDLWMAVCSCPHQLVLMTGDIHWSRAQQIVDMKPAGCHYEIISSALSRIAFHSDVNTLTSINSLTKWNGGEASAIRIADSNAPRNFATISLSRGSKGGLAYRVQWWQFDGNGSLSLIDIYPGRGDIFHDIYQVDFEVT